MTRKFKFIYSFTLLFTLISITGCKANLKISANTDQSCDINCEIDLGPAIINTIKNFTEFNTEQIKSSLSSADLKDMKITTPSETSFSLSGTIQRGGLKTTDFLTCTQDSLTLTVSKTAIQNMAAALPPETNAYLDLLMAPVLTNEELSVQEYKDLISLIYGTDLAAELDSAKINVTLIPPKGKTIKKASLSEKDLSKTLQNKADFSIPLAELLTLQDAVLFSINY